MELPLGSWTIPEICEVACAHMSVVHRNATNAVRTRNFMRDSLVETSFCLKLDVTATDRSIDNS
jgi:hypothetical protein